jgi:hypothetical protein
MDWTDWGWNALAGFGVGGSEHLESIIIGKFLISLL